MEERSPETWNEVASKLRREIKGDECKLLLEAIPSLRKILGGGHQQDIAIVHRRHSNEAALHRIDEEEKAQESIVPYSDSGSHRLNHLMKRVVSVMSSIGDPIVFLIDDVQWANKTDLDVLRGKYIRSMKSKCSPYHKHLLTT